MKKRCLVHKAQVTIIAKLSRIASCSGSDSGYSYTFLRVAWSVCLSSVTPCIRASKLGL